MLRRWAQHQAEVIAIIMAQQMQLFTMLSQPLLDTLSWSTAGMLAFLGHRNASPPSIITEAFQSLSYPVDEGIQAGTHEHQMIERVVRFSECTVRQITTPRMDIHILNGSATLDMIMDEVIESGFSRFPVHEGNPDEIVGVVHVRDLLKLYHTAGKDAQVHTIMQPPLFVPEHIPAASLLSIFRKHQRHLALVVNEFGSIEGLVTLEDVMEEIVGDIADEHDEIEGTSPILTCEDGSLIIDGTVSISQIKQYLQEETLPYEEFYRFDTLAGFVLSLMGRIPKAGDLVLWNRWRIEIVKMDGRRIDKVIMTQDSTATEAQNET